jgi:hypothetical protein
MKNFSYGYPEVSKATGKTECAIRVDANRKKFRMDDLKSVSLYIVSEVIKNEATR